MLRHLSIKNYAIIEEVTFDFSKNLNIITGETGAGKSIILGALNLVLGARADTKILYDKNRKCIVEAEFQIFNYVKSKLKKTDEFDIENDLVVIRREINSHGKSRAFVNDTPVNLSVLRNTGSTLIDLHQQFDTLDVNDPSKQREYVDALAGNEKIRTAHSQKYEEYRSLLRELNVLRNQEKKSAEDLEYLKYQLSELGQADLDSLILEDLESEYKSLTNAEDIQQSLNSFSDRISESEFNISEQLTSLSKEFLPLAEFHPKIALIKEQIDDVNEELLSLQREAQSLSEELEYDEAKILELKDRLDLIYSLQKKHSKNQVSDLIELRDNIELRIQKNDNIEEHIADLEEKLPTVKSELRGLASQVSSSRLGVVGKFSKEIESILHKLSMPNAQFEVEISDLQDFEPHGRDNIEYLFSTNKGIPLNPLNQIASGGELSRLALCIKTIIADKTNLPTMIFDEVDSAVSGQVALIMGQLIDDLSQKYQIITITHSPQVAAHGNHHFLIFKEDRNDRSYTRVKKLDKEERVSELAQMLSGDPPSEAALLNARELLGIS